MSLVNPGAIVRSCRGLRFSGGITVAVIGSVNRDEVRGLDGRMRYGWGGILYNIAALTASVPSRTTLVPIACLGCDAAAVVRLWLGRLSQVNPLGLVELSRPGNLCRLRYVDRDSREEKLLRRVPSLPFDTLRPALASQLIVMNFISGNDVNAATLQRLRRSHHGVIYMDIHSYLLGRRRDGTRFPQRPARWRETVACADILQMNEAEFATLSRCTPGRDAIYAWAKKVLTPLRCQCLLVTLGPCGSFCLVRTDAGWDLSHWPSRTLDSDADPTGAGDTFAGVWIGAWLRGRSCQDASRTATLAAARPAVPDIEPPHRSGRY